MPTGGPGDHPITDIVAHGEEVFDAETNAAIRRIYKETPPPILEMPGSLMLFWPLAEGSHSPWDGMAKPDGFRHSVAALERCWHEMEKLR